MWKRGVNTTGADMLVLAWDAREGDKVEYGGQRSDGVLFPRWAIGGWIFCTGCGAFQKGLVDFIVLGGTQRDRAAGIVGP